MANPLIEQMVTAVGKGYRPKHVWESSLNFHPGSPVKVNKATTGELLGGGSVAIPEGSVVTVVGVGGGPSGVDHQVMLQDGRQAVVPFADLGEEVLRARKVSEQITDVAAKVTLSKPLPDGCTAFLTSGYTSMGVELPHTPSSDSDSAMTFYVKAPSTEVMQAFLSQLEKCAGASFKSSAEATLTDYQKAMG